MKKIIASVACLVALSLPQTNRAQGVLAYLDNTSQPIAGNLALGVVYGSAGLEFQTGTNAGGYLLNDLQLLFGDATGSPVFLGLNVTVLSDYSGALGNFVAFLVPDQNPLTAGFYTYSPQTSTTLEGDTPYWLIVDITAAGTGAYNLSYTSTTASTSPDGWRIITGNTPAGQPGYPIFSINATSTPEPSDFILAILGGALFAFKVKQNSTPQPNHARRQ